MHRSDFLSRIDKLRRLGPARRLRKQRANSGFTIIELIVVVTVIALLAALAAGAYNRLVGDAKRAKSSALVNMLVTAKSMFAADPKTTSAVISAYNSDPDYVSIAPYVRVNGAQPTDEADLLAKSGMPSTVSITLGTIDDRAYGGTHSDQAPTVNGY